MFEKLKELVSSVQTPKMFLLEHDCDPAYLSDIEGRFGPLPDDYRAFIQRFGTAKLFRDSTAWFYWIVIRSKPAVVHWVNDRPVIEVAFFCATPFYLLIAPATGRIMSEMYRPVGETFLSEKRTFSQWLEIVIERAKRKYPKKLWAQIVAGPPPFSPSELEIVRAIERFKVRKIGTDANGDAIFEVHNGAQITLPYLTVGLKAESELEEGAIRLPVQDIRPSQTKVISHPCYKELVPADKIEIRKLQPPGPEDRAYYWEFRSLKAKTKS